MKSAFIRKNTKELRDKLEKLGFEICPCTEFENSVWLDICTSNKSIHGVGYLDEDYTGRKTVQEELDFFLYENEKSQNPQEDCGENEDKFLKIAEDIINGKNSI
jgi:hypothetical protein